MISPTVALAWFALGSVVTAVVAWPRTGLAARAVRRLRRSDSVLAEDVLKRLFHQPRVSLRELARAVAVAEERARRAVARLVAAGLVGEAPDGLALTEQGRVRALQIVRAHRLWERYLADRTGVAEVEWHEEAEREEHRLTPADAERLAARMGRPLVDPHGDPIPDPGGEVVDLGGEPLAGLGIGETAEVVHLEDEPAEPYRRLVEAGLAPGEHLTVIGRESSGLRVELSGASTILNPDEVEAVTVRRSPAVATGRRLSSLRVGETARVMALAPALHGPQRRRLVDLGFVPGTRVEAELASAAGDPVAYRVRGALIALRHDQANLIVVEAA